MNPGKSPKTSHAALAFGVLVMITMLVGAATSVIAMRDRDIEDWRKQMRSMSLILADQSSQTIAAAYLILDSVTDNVEQAGVTDQASFRAKLATRPIYEMLREKIKGIPQVDVATIVAANGDNINFSRAYPVPTINLADRDYFKNQQQNPNLGDFISQPVRNKGNGKWTFYISRRLNDKAGNFMGLALVGISVEVFTDFYARVARDLGEGAAISLYREDLTLLARWPLNDDLIGKVNQSGSTFDIIKNQKKSDDVALYKTPRFSDGVATLRLSAVRKAAKYPMVINLVLTEDLILAGWRRSASLVAGVTALGLMAMLIGLTALMRNLRRRENDIEVMNHLKTEAEMANLAKSQFLANMSHEIRTPMNAILGLLAVVKKTPLTAQQTDYIEKSEGAALALLGLINDILDFSKIEAGKIELDLQPFCFEDLLRDLSVILSTNTGDKQLELLFDIDPELPEWVIGDDMRLRQILINLCGNAIKFTERGQVAIAIKVSQRNDNNVSINIAVSDTGIGIAEEDQQLIFEGFSQAQASTTRRFGGTGLGLAISQRLVEAMGSKLQLTSQPGQGSRFYFQLTLSLASAPETSGRQAKVTSSGTGRKVLIVDDNPDARAAMMQLAKSLGWQATALEGGEQALQLLQESTTQRFDAIFVDWQMPDMDGWETCQRIRALPTGLQAPPFLVMLSANANETLTSRMAAEQALINGFLVKPVTASMLHDTVVEARSTNMEALESAADKATSRRLNGLRLLVVEDNALNQLVAERLLTAEGALVTLAENGQLGVDAVGAAKPQFDLVLMDLQMPIMDGYTATRMIREQLHLTDLPIIAMTANAMASDRADCLAAGMNDHVGKPFNINHLVETLRTHLEHPVS